MFVTIVNYTLAEVTTYMCVRAQTPNLAIVIRFGASEKRESRARESKVEITNTSYAEKDQSQLSLVEGQPAERIFRQPTAAEVSILTFCKLRYARSRAQELSNEFARLLNRGSSLE